MTLQDYRHMFLQQHYGTQLTSGTRAGQNKTSLQLTEGGRRSGRISWTTGEAWPTTLCFLV